MLRVYIMCGIAFSGKSTLAKEIASSINSEIIAFDKLWVEKEKTRSISKDAKGWRFIRNEGQKQVDKALKAGRSVVYDDNNVKFEHREELRKVAEKNNAQAFVIYLNTPLEIVLQREKENRATQKRHEVEPENFQTVLEQLEPPSIKEKYVEFTPNTNLEDFLEKLKSL